MRLPLATFQWYLRGIASSLALATTSVLQAEPDAEPMIHSIDVIDSQEVDLGDRKIIYNRIEAPELNPQEILEPPAGEGSMVTKDYLAAKSLEPEYVRLQVAVTVYPGNFSEVSWQDEESENVVWSNVNFLHFRTLEGVEMNGTVYEFNILEFYAMVDEAGEDGSVEVRGPPPGLPSQERAGPRWVASTGVSPVERGLMDLLHEHYKVNGAELAQESQQIEEERAAAAAIADRERAEAEGRDTVVNFFPIVPEENR